LGTQSSSVYGAQIAQAVSVQFVLFKNPLATVTDHVLVVVG
jgi:hypothetical protein